MRDALESAIVQAKWLALNEPGAPPGHVYLALWRLDPQRDLSESNEWGLNAWKDGNRAHFDQTVIGLLLRLMQVGVEVRIILWQPIVVTDFIVGNAHVQNHLYVARVIEAWNRRLMSNLSRSELRPLGVVILDARVPEWVAPAANQQCQLHEKNLIVRVGSIAEAFCGGIDFGFTRRDAPMMAGDWQSGSDCPWPDVAWPGFEDYPGIERVERPRSRRVGDIPPEVYGDRRQIWHDQHLRLRGPVVQTMESEFRTRWADSGIYRVLDMDRNEVTMLSCGQALFSTAEALTENAVTPLVAAQSVEPCGSTSVQLWHTVPRRNARFTSPFDRGEYTVMAGIANAAEQARELIWIFDQYFWNRPFARMLNRILVERPALRIIIVLPPYAGGGSILDVAAKEVHDAHHLARRMALDDLAGGFEKRAIDRVLVCNTWQDADSTGGGRGIYCHAKSHTYDGSLLVCGSANLNRRSFSRDREMMAAVVDQQVVGDHQRSLWNWLFKGADWPQNRDGVDLNLESSGSGAIFFDFFREQLKSHPSYLVPDSWQTDQSRLPNGVVREELTWSDDVSEFLDLLDPNALPRPEIEVGEVGGEIARGSIDTLDKISFRLEEVHATDRLGRSIWPWRLRPEALSSTDGSS
jgi:phosphatidylserine/phosphatidylglycerophosphate/cardiolipin synthase-like enzyme